MIPGVLSAPDDALIARWVICPMLTEVIPDWGTLRRPKLATMADPGRSPRVEGGAQPIYQYSVIASSGLPGEQNDWCLALVVGVDFRPIALDPEIVDLVEEDFPDQARVHDHLALTPNGRQWAAARLTRVRDRLIERGAVADGLTGDTPLVEWLNRLAAVLAPGSDVRRLKTTERVD